MRSPANPLPFIPPAASGAAFAPGGQIRSAGNVRGASCDEAAALRDGGGGWQVENGE